MNKLLFILILIFAASSCSFQEDPLPNNQILDSTNIGHNVIKANNTITIFTSSIQGQTTGVQIKGQFSEERHVLLPVNSFTVNEHAIPLVIDRYMANFPDSRLNTPNICAEIEKQNLTINVDKDFGSKITDFDIYNPSPIVFSIVEDDQNLSKKAGITLTWEPDNSILREDQLIGLQVVFRGLINDETTVQLDNINFTKSIPDNGEIYLSEEELSIFPDDAKIDINMIRGNYALIENNGIVETLIISHSMDSHRTILTQ